MRTGGVKKSVQLDMLSSYLNYTKGECGILVTVTGYRNVECKIEGYGFRFKFKGSSPVNGEL